VNLIGEHTDYNMGLVFPMALPLVTVVVGAAAKEGGYCKVTFAAATGEMMSAQFSLDSTQPGEPAWANYFKVNI
jgi:galactokinase